MYVGLFAMHLFSLNFIFISDGSPAAADERKVLQMYSTASLSHAAAMDGHRAVKLV